MKTTEERIKECRSEIEKLLKKYELALDCAVVLKAGSVTPMIDLVDMQKKPQIIKP
jgi:hypothetical protein